MLNGCVNTTLLRQGVFVFVFFFFNFQKINHKGHFNEKERKMQCRQ